MNRTNLFFEDSIRVTTNLLLSLGLRHEFELKTLFPRDYNNIGPRIGFAWSPNPKTVVRGGYGFYYSRIDGQIAYINELLGDNEQIYQLFIPLTGFPNILSGLTGQPLTSAEIYQTLRGRGVIGQRPIVPDDLRVHGIQPSRGYPLRIGFRVVDDFVNPYSQQGSFELQREVGGYALSAGYNYNRGSPPGPAPGPEHLPGRNRPGDGAADSRFPQPPHPAGQRIRQLGQVLLSRYDLATQETLFRRFHDLGAPYLEQDH